MTATPAPRPLLDPDPAGGPFRGRRSFPADEPFFAGHFPGLPVVPGVFLLEAMAECVRAGLAEEDTGLAEEDTGLAEEDTGLAENLRLRGATGVRFRRRIEPGDRVDFEARESEADPASSAGGRRFRAEALVDGRRAVEATLEFA